MPWSYAIDTERRLVQSVAFGVITAAEGLAHQDQLANDPNFDPDFHQLADLSGVTKLEINAGDVRRLSQKHLFSSKSRRAFVTRNPAMFGLARMFQIHRERSEKREEIEVFSDLQSALKWLGIDDLDSSKRA